MILYLFWWCIMMSMAVPVWRCLTLNTNEEICKFYSCCDSDRLDSITWLYISITIFMIFSLILLQTAFISWDDRYWFEYNDFHLYNYLGLECSKVWWKMGIKKMGNNKHLCVAIRHSIWNHLLLLVSNDQIFRLLFQLYVMFICFLVLLTQYPLPL